MAEDNVRRYRPGAVVDQGGHSTVGTVVDRVPRCRAREVEQAGGSRAGRVVDNVRRYRAGTPTT